MSTVAINRDGYADAVLGTCGAIPILSYKASTSFQLISRPTKERSGPFFLGRESVASDECLLFEVHQLAEADFCWGIALRFDHGFFAGNIIDLDQDKAGFDAGDVEATMPAG